MIKNCHMRHKNGNCLPAGGFCTASKNICEALHNAYELGRKYAQPEIIKCKDCKWREDQSGSTAWLPCIALVVPDDFYCGRAERRTDER